MIIRLNPRYPLVWRSPDTIQFGVDRALLVLPGVTPAQERVLAALRGGVPRAGAEMLGRQAGASPADTAALLRALRPVLEAPALETAELETAVLETPVRGGRGGDGPPVVAASVCVDGSGPTADRIRGFLGDLGIPTRLDDADPALAVVVGHYVLEPARHRRWLRRDVPHLPVVFSDREIRVGPLVEPGRGPCLHCLELARVDQDPAWPAMACQLLGREAPTETARASIDVAARVAGLVQDRLATGRTELSAGSALAAGSLLAAHSLLAADSLFPADQLLAADQLLPADQLLAANSLAFDTDSGEVRRRGHRPHERCGCRSLPGNVTVLSGTAAAVPMPPSSGRAAAVPA